MKHTNFIRILALLLCVLMLCAALVSCGEGIVTPEQTVSNGNGGGASDKEYSYHVSSVETIKYYGDLTNVKDYVTEKVVKTSEYDEYSTVQKVVTVTEQYDENGRLTNTSTQTSYPNQNQSGSANTPAPDNPEAT